MNKCIAIPMENGVLSTHFGHCQYFTIATVENDQIIDIKELTPPDHEPGVYPRWVASFGVTDVIAGGMGQKAISLFNNQNIHVFVGAPLEGARDIIENFLADKLSLNANYCNHDDKHEHNCKH